MNPTLIYILASIGAAHLLADFLVLCFIWKFNRDMKADERDQACRRKD